MKILKIIILTTMISSSSMILTGGESNNKRSKTSLFGNSCRIFIGGASMALSGYLGYEAYKLGKNTHDGTQKIKGLWNELVAGFQGKNRKEEIVADYAKTAGLATSSLFTGIFGLTLFLKGVRNIIKE